MTVTTEIGKARARKEDARLVTGQTSWTDNIQMRRRRCTIALVRSPYAHATIRSVDLVDARASPGVVAAFSGADLRRRAGGLPCAWPVTADMKAPLHLPLAVEQVAYVGDAVAVVVARSGYEAVDAAAAVVVDYEPLPAVVDLEAARAEGAEVHPSWHEVVRVALRPGGRRRRVREGAQSSRSATCSSA